MRLSIDVFSTAASVDEDDVRGHSVVVIDVLRASSTIVTALHNGAKAIVAVGDMADAGKMASRLDPSQYLLCGEKDGRKIDGYHLGNSPFEYTTDVVGEKTLIFNTTNGTKAITRAEQASALFIGCFLNARVVIDALKHRNEGVLLVCAGWKNRLSMEDLLCAGLFVYALYDGTIPDDATDGAKIAFSVYDRYRQDIPGVIKKTNHANRLREFVDDAEMDYCASVNLVPALPVFEDGVIVLK